MSFKNKKTFKKIASIVLLLVTVLSTFQFSVFAEDTSATSGDWTYYIDDTLGGAYITAYSGKAETVTIPSQLGGKTVKAVGAQTFLNNSTLKKITISSSITTIGDYCFLNASKLSSVSIPSSVTSLGTSVFSGCTSLSSVSLGSGITTLSTGLFNKCTSLTSVTGGENVTTIEYAAFSGCTALASTTIPAKTQAINSNAFEGCVSLKSITIPEATSYIGEYAFKGCTSLSTVTINGANHEFGNGVFENTAAYNNANNWINGNFVLSGCLLKAVDQSAINIPEGVKTIPGGILLNFSVKTINLSSTVAYIGENALTGLSSLEAVTVSSANKAFSASDGVLIRKSDSSLILYPAKKKNTSYSVPSTVKKIGPSAFEYNESLTSVTLPSTLTDIGSKAFIGCSKLSTISLNSGLKTISKNAFQHCTAIKTITIPDTVTTVEENAFSGCSALTEAKISSGMKEISTEMFSGCTSLKKVTLGNNISAISSFAFSGCSALSTIDIGTNIKTIGSNAFENCSSIKSIDTKADIESYAFAYCTGLTTFKMKAGTSIGPSAFIGCTSLSTVELPSSLETIESECFFDCSSLKKISVPQNVAQIGSYALGFVSDYGIHEKVSGFVIEGYSYSAAESYASSNGITFKKLDIESPGSIRKDNVKKIIYLGGLKVASTHLRDYLKSVGICKTCTITKANGSAIPSGSYVGTGCKATLDGTQYTIVINGETTGDGIVNSSDYLQIKKCFLKIYSFDEYSFLAADVNPNGRIDTTDYLRIKLHFLGQYNLLG